MAGEPFGLTGQLLDGQYRIERAIGEGGFSVVYRGMHQGIGEPIAIKCLKLNAALDTESIENFTRRFRDEGRLLYRLGQGNLDIVRVIISGTTVSPATGAIVPYMVLEWLDGQSLAADLKSRRDKKLRGRSLEEMVALFEPGALALEHAHRQGVVHRDVKPGNLFLAASQAYGTRMKVLDFGLAKILDETTGITLAATQGNFMMCSPRYAAPEQFDPKVGAIGPWTDVYSLALVLLESLRDARIRKGDGLIACMSEAIDPKTNLTAAALGMQLPRRIDAALGRAVSLDVRARQRSAGELWEEIKAGMRERIPVQWQPAGPLDTTAAMEPSTRSPASLGADTIIDPVLSVPLDALGGTIMMPDAPQRPVIPASTQAPVTSPMPGRPSAQPPDPLASALAAAVRASAPASPPVHRAPTGAAPETFAIPVRVGARRRKSRAPVVLVILLVLAMLGAGGFFGWRAWKVRSSRAAASPALSYATPP